METPQPEIPVAPYSEQLTLMESRHEYDEVYTYVFKPANPVPFVAGQYAHVRLLDLPEGVKRVRELSFASSPEDADIWFGVDGKSKSDYQLALRALQPGDTLEIFKIKGHMTWPAPVADVVMIANGVGVTPFRSMLRDEVQKSMPVSATLVHVARESFLYAEELRESAGTYLPITRDLLANSLDSVIATHPNAHYYIAGSDAFVQDVQQRLSERGIGQIESDVFKGWVSE